VEPALGGVGAAKEVLQNSTSICTTAPWSWQLHGVLELGCLAGKLAGVAGVQLQSHAKHPLNISLFKLQNGVLLLSYDHSKPFRFSLT